MKRRVLLEFLERLFPKKEIVMSFLLIPLMVSMVYAQSITVSGTVIDDEGLPLPGVSVTVKGTRTATQTNEKGEYRINVPGRSSVLTFSFIGFTNQDATVGSRTKVDIKLLPTVNKLDDVVIVGYGTQVKRDVTGSIASVSAEAIEERVPTNIFEALQGASPGVRVTGDSGAPGAESQIFVRGVSSLSEGGGAPLYVVDGVALDNINGISPNDIQNIEILKDAASASIYGARSANGVVLITTKRGQEGKPKIDLNYIRSYSSLANKLPQANRLGREIFDMSRQNFLGVTAQRSDSTNYDANNDNDYQDLITQTGARDQVDFSISGGAKGLTYYSGLQYLSNDGIIVSSYNKRLTFRTNVDYSPTSKIKLSTRVNFGYENWNNIDEGKSIGQASERPPQFALYLPDGSFIYDAGGRKHPLGELLLRTDERTRYQGVFSQAFDYKIATPLTFHIDASADVRLTRREQFSSALLETTNPSSALDNTSLPRVLQGNATLTYKKTYNKAHNLSGLLGTNIIDRQSREINMAGKAHISELVRTFNSVSQKTLTDVYTDGSGSSLFGFFGRVGYDYKGRYYVNATFRRDASSRFGDANRWGNFPAISGGWRISDERFMSWSKKFLTDAKLRASWGIMGDQDLGDFDSRNSLQVGKFFYNGVAGVQTGSQLGNPGLKWAQQEQINLGLDLSFFNGRATLTGDYYVKETKDLLYNLALPSEIGYTGGSRINFGSMRNNGVEIDLSTYPIRSKSFQWQSALNWSYNRNKITELKANNDNFQNLWLLEVGQEAGQFIGYKYMGIYEYDESNAYTPDFKTRLIPEFEKDEYGNTKLNKNLQPTFVRYLMPDGTPYAGDANAVGKMYAGGSLLRGGDIIWDNLPDANGAYNGSIDNADRQILGSGIPRHTLGFNNTFNYRKFSFSMNLFGSFGNKVYNERARNNAQFSSTNVTPFPNVIRDLWKYPGQITTQYRHGSGGPDNVRQNGSYFLEDGSFIRLQTVRLSYDIPTSVSKRVLARSLNVYVYSNSLATWTSYSGLDPEVNQNSVLTPGRDTGRYPRKREFGLGLVSSF
jgi:TonB-dependent starch-binding outer membrane protein SusC